LRLVKEKFLPYALLIAFTMLHAAGLVFDLAPDLPDYNDGNLHIVISQAIVERAEALENPIDFWLPHFAGGFPLLHHYQFFPHLTVALVYFLLFTAVPVSTIYHLLVVLLLLAQPWVVFLSLKRMGSSQWTCVFAALLSLAALDGDGYGHGLASYLRSGHGLYTQLFAMTFFLPFIASVHRLLAGEKEGYFKPVLFGALLGLSHIFALYLALCVAGVLWLINLRPATWLRVSRRFWVSVVLILVCLAFFLVPLALDSGYHANSPYEHSYKLDSFGAGVVLDRLFTGQLLDNGRLPMLSLLCLAGFLLCLQKRNKHNLAIAAGFIVSLLLYFGRPTWGALLKLLPLSGDLHFHRFIIGVHVFGIALAGIALAQLVEIGKSSQRKISHAAAIAVVVLSLGLIYQGQAAFIVKNAKSVKEMSREFRAEKPVLDKLIAKLPQDRSRSYAGLRAGWGGKYAFGNVPVYNLLALADVPAISYLAFGWSLAGDFSVQINERRYAHLNLFNIGSIMSWRDDEYWRGVATLSDIVGNHAIYRVATAGWFELVQAQFAAKADKRSYWDITTQWMKSGLLEKRQYLRYDFDHLPILRPGERMIEPDFAQVEIGETPYPYFGAVLEQKRLAAGDFVAKVRADAPCYLLLKCTYHPGWIATVNGRRIRPVMLTPAFVGVAIDEGTWDVRLKYAAPVYKTPLLLIGIFLLAFLWYRERGERT